MDYWKELRFVLLHEDILYFTNLIVTIEASTACVHRERADKERSASAGVLK